MVISRNITRKLLGAVFAMATATSLNLCAMECPSVGDWELFPEYFRIRAVAQHCVGSENIFPTELTQYIFFLNKQALMVDHIAQSCTNPRLLVPAIADVCKRFGPNLSVEIVSMGLAKAGKSIVDIKDKYKQTALHIAAEKVNVEVVKVLLAVADKQGKALELILMRNSRCFRAAFLLRSNEWTCKDRKILNAVTEILSTMQQYAPSNQVIL